MRDVEIRQTRPAHRNKRRRRGGNRTLHYVLFTVVLLSVAVILSLTVLFEITLVSVSGVDKYPAEDLVRDSGVVTGENLFRVDHRAVSENLLEKYPYIDTVTVRLRPPHEIMLELTECTAAGALKEGGDYIMITADGKVLERGLLYIPENIPLILGLNTNGAQPGKILGMSEDGKTQDQNIADALRMLEYLFAAVEETGFGMPTNVDLTDVYNMKIIHENRLLLNLGTESELVAKLHFLKNMIDEQLSKDAQGLINAEDIGARVIYESMPVEEARRRA